MQEPYPVSYQADIKKLLSYSQLFHVLLTHYRLCVGCVYRTMWVTAPKMYSDLRVFKKIGKEMLENLGKNEEISEDFLAMGGQFKEIIRDPEEYFQSFTCWLCSGILQASYLENLSS